MNIIYAFFLEEECLLLSSYSPKRSVTQTRLITTIVGDCKEYSTRSWRGPWQTSGDTVFSMKLVGTCQITQWIAYQVYIYLHFENKSCEAHNPELKYLTSEQKPIAEPQSQCYCILPHHTAYACCKHCWGLRKSQRS